MPAYSAEARVGFAKNNDSATTRPAAAPAAKLSACFWPWSTTTSLTSVPARGATVLSPAVVEVLLLLLVSIVRVVLAVVRHVLALLLILHENGGKFGENACDNVCGKMSRRGGLPCEFFALLLSWVECKCAPDRCK